MYAKKKKEFSSEDHISSLAEAELFGVFFTDANLNYMSRNLIHDQIFGYSSLQNNWNYEKFLNHVDPADRDTIDKLYQEAIGKSKDFYFECGILRIDNSQGRIGIKGHSLKDTAGQTFFVILIKDITEVYKSTLQTKDFFNIEKIIETFPDFNQAAHEVLKILTNQLNFEIGEIWLSSQPQYLLNCTAYYIKPTIEIKKSKSEYNQYPLSENIFHKEEIKKNKILSTTNLDPYKKFFKDTQNDKDFSVAIGVPIIFREKPLGMMVLVSSQEHNLNYETEQMLMLIANRLGEFFKHKVTITKLEYLTEHDTLTGALNRFAFVEKLETLLNSNESDLIAVVKLELDRFKAINNELGYHSGNLILQEVTDKLSEIFMNETGILARIGPYRFGILLFNFTSIGQIANFAKYLLNVISEPLTVEGKELVLTASIGISLFPDNGRDANTLLAAADFSLVNSQEQGGNYFHFSAMKLPPLISEEFNIDSALHRAIINNQFELFYQPKVELKTGKIVGLEALLRWNDPVNGLRLPQDFLAIAEKSDLIVAIGEWVLIEVAKQISSQNINLPIAVNLSVRQFLNQYDLAKFIKRLIKKFKFDLDKLELEVNETTLMIDIKRSLEILLPLHKLGIKIAYDDFGMGCSSFNYLKQFVPNRIKINKTFIQDIPKLKNNKLILKAIVALCKSLDTKLTAKGVETIEQIQFLKSIDCDEMQGFYFAEPLPLEKVKRLILEDIRLTLP